MMKILPPKKSEIKLIPIPIQMITILMIIFFIIANITGTININTRTSYKVDRVESSVQIPKKCISWMPRDLRIVLGNLAFWG